MQFPESWLRQFCDPPIDSSSLAELLTMAGMEVEEVRTVAPAFSGIVVGEVLAVATHPNADRLHVCQVNAGTGSTLDIVCGAPNVRVGIKVACALVGALLPLADDAKPGEQPFQIRLSRLRGVQSEGMLCSARELRLSDDHAGLIVLSDAAVIGQDVREHLGLDDKLFTLKLTPNLAHCLSVYGVAREVSALTGAPLVHPAFAPVKPRIDSKLPVRVDAADLCGRFSGRIVRNVNPKAPTPTWMVDRLARCGQRSVTALVDISNYVLFEYGRPTHIFDLDKIHDSLTVRWGRANESLRLLNGSTVELDEKVGVIADSQAVESLAGIMGGEATAVSGETQNIYVEAAFWWPEAVAGRSRRFGFSTEAGHRFERGVDPSLTVEHLEHVTQLIVDICGGAPGPMDDQILALPERKPVRLRIERARKVIGMPVTQEQCEGVMRRLGLAFTSEAGSLTVTPPSWRFDLQIEEDLIEEVIRVLGYETLPDAPPLARVEPRVQSESKRGMDSLRHQMASLDYQETINFSFVDERWETELAGNPDPVRLVNPMASHLAVMRSSLIGSLVAVLRQNLSRKATRVRVFEAGRVFLRDPAAMADPGQVAGVAQPMRLAGLAYGGAAMLQWAAADREVDFFDMKGDLETLFAPVAARFVPAEHPAMHPGRCARVELNGAPAGFVGELHPKWRQAYELPAAPMLFELDAAVLLPRAVPVYAPVQRQQSVWRDLSLIASEAVTNDLLMQAIAHATEASLIRSARLFDVYRPATPSGDMRPGERGMSVRLELLDDEVTLTDERIDAAVADVLAVVGQRLGARLRA